MERYIRARYGIVLEQQGRYHRYDNSLLYPVSHRQYFLSIEDSLYIC